MLVEWLRFLIRWGVLGGIKLDISDLHKHGIGWDDPIPNSMKNVWGANFDIIQEIGNIEFHRAVIPPDALNLDIETLEIADASKKLICAAVYARFECSGGGGGGGGGAIPVNKSLPEAECQSVPFPLQSVTDLKLSSKEDREVNKEVVDPPVDPKACFSVLSCAFFVRGVSCNQGSAQDDIGKTSFGIYRWMISPPMSPNYP